MNIYNKWLSTKNHLCVHLSPVTTFGVSTDIGEVKKVKSLETPTWF